MIPETTIYQNHPEIREIGNIEDLVVEDKYHKIWSDVSLSVQTRKARNHNLSIDQTEECFSQLSRRPNYLCNLAKLKGVKNIAEVGTAQGLQFFSFAEYVKEQQDGGHVWSCDIIDARNQEYSKKYEEHTTFSLGNSEKLCEILKDAGAKIDLFYIDGGHEYEDLVRDVYHLRVYQSENPVWVFDDFDERFGCYRAILSIMKINKDFMVYRVGSAASGNPNHQVIVFGKL